MLTHLKKISAALLTALLTYHSCPNVVVVEVPSMYRQYQAIPELILGFLLCKSAGAHRVIGWGGDRARGTQNAICITYHLYYNITAEPVHELLIVDWLNPVSQSASQIDPTDFQTVL